MEATATLAPSTPPALAGFGEWALLGRGGFADVFSARRAGEHRPVVVKVATGHAVDRVEREAAALSALGPPLAPGLIDRGVTADGSTYLVMELVDGVTLGDWMARRNAEPSPDVASALTLFHALCRAVDKMHAQGWIHRDLKPENIFCSNGSEIRLIDFGLACAGRVAAEPPEARLTRTGTRLGTVTYMAPEQCLGSSVDERADLYALGVILFELLTGRPPFMGPAPCIERDHIMTRVPSAAKLAGLPAAVDDVLRRALAKEPQSRPARAGELAAAIEVALSKIATARVEPSAEPVGRASSRRMVALLALRADGLARNAPDIAATSGAIVVATSPERCVFAYPHLDNPAQAVRAALSTAERVQACTAVVHCAQIRVRESASSIMMIGPAVDNPLSWWPEREVAPLLLTKAAAELLGLDMTAPTSLPDFFTLAVQVARGSAGVTRLCGRASILQALQAQALTCWSTRSPTLTTVLGEVGVGKTRCLDALATELDGSDVTVLRIGLDERDRERPDAFARGLLLALLDLPPTPTVAQVRAACARHSGDDDVEQLARAAALVIGAFDDDEARAAAARFAPGALRQVVAASVAHALEERAATRPVALLVDDADRADAAALDAVEIASALVRAPLWICVFAQPSLCSLRPTWGERASHHEQVTLGPLAAAPAAELLRELLRPVDFISDSLIAQLVERTGGVPLYLVELCEALRRSGAIRRHPHSEAWHLAPDELLHAAPGSLLTLVAQRQLADLPAPILSVARVGAVLGDPFACADLVRVADMLEESTASDEVAVDPAFGLDRLVRLGLLESRAEGQYRFRNPVLRGALESTMPSGLRQRIHRLCWSLFETEGGGGPMRSLRLARHAAVAGEDAVAAQHFLRVADDARAQQRWLDAEQHYSSALERLHDRGDDAMRAHLSRGRVRYRLGQLRESIVDLRRARAMALERGLAYDAADAMLEEATVLDWLEDFTGSSDVTRDAAPLVARATSPVLDARWSLANARSIFRLQSEWSAIDALFETRSKASAVADYETEMIVLLLLPYALLQSRRIGEAERLAAEAIALCEQAGDRVHLAVAHLNRVYVSMLQGDHERALEDLQTASRLAREFGLSKVEAHAAHAKCEMLYWFGDLAGASKAVQELLETERRFGAPNPDLLILATRIYCAATDLEAARVVRATILERELRDASHSSRFLLSLVDHFLATCEGRGDAAAALRRLAERPQHWMYNDELEAHYWVAAAMARQGDLAAMRAFASDVPRMESHPTWAARFAELPSRWGKSGASR